MSDLINGVFPMSNLLNPKPRFGLDLEHNTMFDYLTSRDIPVTEAAYVAPDGTWNLALVKSLILSGKTIEAAISKPTAIKPPAPIDQVLPGEGTPKKAADAPTSSMSSTAARPLSQAPGAPTGTFSAPSGARHAITASELQALSFEPLQLAAMGISQKQLKADGLTAAQVADVGMSPARATALKLTPAQTQALVQ